METSPHYPNTTDSATFSRVDASPNTCARAATITFIVVGLLLTLGALGLIGKYSGSLSPEIERLFVASMAAGFILIAIGCCMRGKCEEPDVETPHTSTDTSHSSTMRNDTPVIPYNPHNPNNPSPKSASYLEIIEMAKQGRCDEAFFKAEVTDIDSDLKPKLYLDIAAEAHRHNQPFTSINLIRIVWGMVFYNLVAKVRIKEIQTTISDDTPKETIVQQRVASFFEGHNTLNIEQSLNTIDINSEPQKAEWIEKTLSTLADNCLLDETFREFQDDNLMQEPY